MRFHLLREKTYPIKTRIRRFIMFTMMDDSPEWMQLWRVYPLVQRIGCLVVNHEPERDQCGRPEHDFCFWCEKPMPFSWKKK